MNSLFQDKLPDTHLDPPTVKRMIPLPVIGIDDVDPMLKDNEGSIIVSYLLSKTESAVQFNFIFNEEREREREREK